MNLLMRIAFSLVMFSIFMLIDQTSVAEDWLCNESPGQSWASANIQNLPKEKTQDLITINLYVHMGGKNGPLLSGVTVDAKDDADVRYIGKTSNGYLILKGKPGIWKLTISRDDLEPETVVEAIFVSGRDDIYFSGELHNAKQENESEISISASLGNLNNERSINPFSVDFDLRDMKGFKDNVISSDEIELFIQSKASTSPMLGESDIGKCFINAGQTNYVNPAFLVAVAYSESGFGTKGWAKINPESHNSLGYGVNSDDIQPNAANSAESWCAMVNRVAIVIAKGNSYYKRNRFSIAQVSSNYSKSIDLDLIVSVMNELYFFSASRSNGYALQPSIQTTSQESSPAIQKEAIELGGYKPTYKPSQSGYRPSFIPKGTSTVKEPVELG